MFVDFLAALRRAGVPVSLTEWLQFVRALDAGCAGASLRRFYNVARALLVKRETDFDRFDEAFLEVFGAIEEVGGTLLEEILAGIKKGAGRQFTDEEKAAMTALDLEEVLARFREQLRKGRFHGHQGGSQAIGTGGTSTQGAFGYNPAGIRIGQGQSIHGRAIQIAEERRFRNYRSDLTLDVRQMKVALSRLREFAREGLADELDVEATIDSTCRDGGELHLEWRARKVDRARFLLLMDAGGSMSPHAHAVNLLFSAARDHFRSLESYYFHNCVYQDLWTDIARNRTVPTVQVLDRLDERWHLVLVADASMAPSELLSPGGAIDYWYRNPEPGLVWLRRFRNRFPRSVWLNPLPELFWNTAHTISTVGEVFPMFPLTLDGLEDAMRHLARSRRPGGGSATRELE